MNFFRCVTILVLAGWGLLPGRDDCARAAAPALPAAAEYANLDDLFTLYQPYLGHISAYESIYFLVGTNLVKSKFQFSFRYRLLTSKGPLAARHPWVKGVHFGYTQTSFWDLESDSAPFADTSYKPELFHLSGNLPGRPAWLQGLFLQSGLRHESNGRKEDESRSSNILYLKPLAIFYRPASGLGLQISPQVWVYLNNGEQNGDLADYRGYFALEAKAGKADGLVAEAALRWAREGGSLRIDLTYPVPRYLSDNLAVYLQIQYVNGLAEDLLNYRERTEALRLGFSFVR
jgi:outer membrane phospholipase A